MLPVVRTYSSSLMEDSKALGQRTRQGSLKTHAFAFLHPEVEAMVSKPSEGTILLQNY